MTKVSGIVLSIIVLFISCFITLRASSGMVSTDGTSFIEKAEKSYVENMPLKEKLSSLATSIKYSTGIRYFDGIYIGNDGSLLKDVTYPSTRVTTTAKSYINATAEKNASTYFCLLPTSVVIKQQEIDGYAAEKLVNQRKIINEMYSDLYGVTRTVDVYQTLFGRRNEYIYYHTEDMLTGLGSYYVYSELMNRMGASNQNLSSFSTSFREHDFYGSLSNDQIKRYATPDFISLYENVSEDREYTVTRYEADGSSTRLNGLFIEDGEFLEDKTDMFLGGMGAVTLISDGKKGGNQLIVFCNEKSKSILTLLATYYDNIKAVDLDKASDKQLKTIDVSNYSDVLFIYSVDDFAEGIDFTRLELIK